nr:hypothetical protein [Eubacterium sp.]
MRYSIRKIVCGILVASLTIGATGCSEKKEEPKKTVQVEKAAAVSDGELKADSVVVGVGGTKVLYQEYQAYDWFLRNQYEGLMTADVWNYNLGETTVGQLAVEDCLRLIIQIKVLNKAAAEQGIALAVDEKEDIDYKADQYLATIPPEVQQANGITTEMMHIIFEENEIARKMYDVVTGNVEATIDEAAMQAAKVLLYKEPANDSNREEVRAKVNTLVAEKANYTGNFYSFIKDKTGTAPEEVIIGKMDGRVNLVNTALTMERHSISGVIEEKDGFYVIQCLKSNTKALNKNYREQYIAEQQSSAFQAAYENYAEKYEVKVSKSLLAK